jgi:dUTPase
MNNENIDLKRLAEQLKIEEQKAKQVQKKAKPEKAKPEIPHSIAVKFGKQEKEPEPPPEPELEDRPKPKAEVVTKLPESPVEKANVPSLKAKIATKITVDDPMFIPHQEEGKSLVSLAANLSTRGTIRMPFRSIETVDCGFGMTLHPGYKAVLTLNSLFAHKGLFISGSGIIEGEGEHRVALTVINCGHQIIEVHHGDWLAQMRIESVLSFEFLPTVLEV